MRIMAIVPTTPWWSSEPKIPTSMLSSLVCPNRIRTPFTTAAAPLKAEKIMTSRTGTASRNVPMANRAPRIRPTTIAITPVPNPKYSKKPMPSE